MSASASIQLVRDLDRLEIDNKKRAAHQDRSDLLQRAEVLATDAYALGVPDLIGAFHLRHGSILFDAGLYPQALTETESATASLGNLRQADLLVSVLALRARCCYALQHWQALEDTAARGIMLVEQHRYKVSAPYLKAGYMRSRIALYVLGAEAALQRGDLPTALLRTDLCKSRGVSGLAQRGTDNAETEKLLARFERVNVRINRARAAERDINKLLNERRALWDLIEISRTRGADITLPVFDWEAVRKALQPSQAVIYYFWLDRLRLLIIVFDKAGSSFEIKTLDKDARESLALFAAGVQAITDETPVSWIDTVQDFADILWPGGSEATAILQRADRLIISPHRLLHSIPFSALEIAGEFLIRKFAVRLIPNLTALLAHFSRYSGKDSVLTLGVEHYNVPGSPLRALPLAEEEAANVVELYHQAERNAVQLPGLHTHVQTITDAITTYKPDVLHLACHGDNIESDTPMESRLYLSNTALEALEISSLGIGADLVVLSACSSGQRAISGRGMDDLPGDDIFGLQAAFFAAGTRELVASLYPVDSSAARDICTGLHRYLKMGYSTDKALQSAICDYIDNAGLFSGVRHYWAPFILSALGRSDPAKLPAE